MLCIKSCRNKENEYWVVDIIVNQCIFLNHSLKQKYDVLDFIFWYKKNNQIDYSIFLYQYVLDSCVENFTLSEIQWTRVESFYTLTLQK